ncbi:hypothetical protein BpHYR1_022657 [Brachionus plicatilis]|uniref:Uncharacterized protein n=1 Tax=Brachionus plicatilis TaxID=10195 RepID=A0A3M7P2Y2_BRAPC|nr:hypothetical protein BpHYR1_022657 [Brachionus plicatilis]
MEDEVERSSSFASHINLVDKVAVFLVELFKINLLIQTQNAYSLKSIKKQESQNEQIFYLKILILIVSRLCEKNKEKSMSRPNF